MERHRGNVVQGGKLAASLGVSRTAVWKAVRVLREDGNRIESLQGSGYRLCDESDGLSSRIIQDNLDTVSIGRNIIQLQDVHSTNRYLKEAAYDKPHGFTVIADGQSEGQGRRGRTFLSPKGQGVYMSILLKPEGELTDIRRLTILAAAAVSRAVENLCGIETAVKWVNDVFCDGKKICGILTEAVISGEIWELDAVVVGIGVNTGDVPEDIGDKATSIGLVLNRTGFRNRLAAFILNEFEALYLELLERDGWPGILSYYESRLFILGKRVLVTAGDFEGVVQGVDRSGALLVLDSQGTLRTVISGEIIIVDNQEEQS